MIVNSKWIKTAYIWRIKYDNKEKKGMVVFFNFFDKTDIRSYLSENLTSYVRFQRKFLQTKRSTPLITYIFNYLVFFFNKKT